MRSCDVIVSLRLINIVSVFNL